MSDGCSVMPLNSVAAAHLRSARVLGRCLCDRAVSDRRIAEIRDGQQFAAAYGRFVGDDAWERVARGHPDAVRGRCPVDAGPDEVVDEILVRTGVPAGETGELAG